jgi:hypothetical protein
MKEPRTTIDGRCPQCSADDYRLASACHAEQPTPDSAPPARPVDYASKGNRLINCDKRLHTAAKVRNCYWLLKSKFDDDCAVLRDFHAYERQHALWKCTRVCQVCGEYYVREEDRLAASASFEMPTWTVEIT